MEKKHVIVGITGASGAIYALRTLRALLSGGHSVELVASKYGLLTLRDETGFGGFSGDLPAFLVAEYGDAVKRGTLTAFGHNDQTARIASGSGGADGMIVVPCTVKTLAGIAHGLSSNLIERAADVTLKERRRLVLVVREAPYGLVHLRNMVAATEAGAVIVPASPAFYQKPRTFDDLADFIAQRALKLLGIEAALFPAWEGIDSGGGGAPGQG